MRYLFTQSVGALKFGNTRSIRPESHRNQRKRHDLSLARTRVWLQVLDPGPGAPYTASMVANWCVPTWHTAAETWAKDKRPVTSCPVITTPDARFPVPGFVPCNPEALRQSAEKKLREWKILDEKQELSLDVYAAGRLVRSEWGSGPVEGKVAIVECAMNRAKMRKQSVSDLLFTNRFKLQLFGRQHAVKGYGSQGRWASTSRDPTVGDLMIASFTLAGHSKDFARGGAGFLDPSGMGDRLVPVLKDWMKRSVWVGHLPGVPIKKLFVLRHNTRQTPADQATNQQGLVAVTLQQDPANPTEQCEKWSPWVRAGAVLGTASLVGMGVGYAAVEFGQRRFKDWPLD